VPATKPGQRTDLGKPVERTTLAANPRDPLYFETESMMPVDFLSFRRAFNTALAARLRELGGRAIYKARITYSARTSSAVKCGAANLERARFTTARAPRARQAPAGAPPAAEVTTGSGPA
jgi:hypothetical protein